MAPSPIKIDFLSIEQQKRLTHTSLLLKAIGNKKDNCLKILDATAGLGRDAYLFAYYGNEVLMLERNEDVYQALQQALASVKEEIKLALKFTDAIEYLNTTTNLYDVIYLDPMYEIKNRTALPKKDLQELSTLVGPDQDTDTLFQAALDNAKRVVIKRHPKMPYITSLKPTFSISGKLVRYDVYSGVRPQQPSR